MELKGFHWENIRKLMSILNLSGPSINSRKSQDWMCTCQSNLAEWRSTCWIWPDETTPAHGSLARWTLAPRAHRPTSATLSLLRNGSALNKYDGGR